MNSIKTKIRRLANDQLISDGASGSKEYSAVILKRSYRILKQFNDKNDNVVQSRAHDALLKVCEQSLCSRFYAHHFLSRFCCAQAFMRHSLCYSSNKGYPNPLVLMRRARMHYSVSKTKDVLFKLFNDSDEAVSVLRHPRSSTLAFRQQCQVQ